MKNNDITKEIELIRDSEEKYRLIYSNMSQGLAIHEIITDDAGKPIDYIFLDINKSYETLLEVKKEDVIGKRITEVMPKVESYWIEVFGKVALTGIPMEYENYLETTGRYYNTYSYSPKPRQFAVLVTDITEHRKVIEELKIKEENLLKTQEIAHIGTWRLDIKTNHVVWTEELYKMYGFDPKLPPPPYTEHMKLFTPESWVLLSSSLALTSSQGIPYELELETITKDGSNGWMWVRGEAEKNDEGEIIAIWGAAQDITNRVNIKNRLQRSEERYRGLVENLDEGFVIHATNTSIISCNPKASDLLGINQNQLIGKFVSDPDFNFINENGTKMNVDQYPVNLIKLTMKPIKNITLGIKHIKENKIVWVVANGIPIFNSDGRLAEIVVSFKDVTYQQQYNSNLEYLSNHDYLTDLYNRRFFFEQFNEFDKPKYFPLGIMMLDVNGLKIVNDAFGHAAGDVALKMLSNVLENTFEIKDVVARMGGDEFSVLLPNTSYEKLQQYKDQLKVLVNRQKIENVELSIAIGYELKNSSDTDIDDMLKLAENHMYRHKSTEGSSVRSRAINAILETLTNKYGTERKHSFEVSQLCGLIGKQLELREDEIKLLEQAGMFHDIGKISIPDSILNKPGELTKEEFDIIKSHTEVGYQILRAADEYSDLAIHALHHHERWDGLGYPSGLKGEEIPLFSRIICIVDAYEAMTADRPYRSKQTKDYAVSEITKYSGTQFDPAIAEVFLKLVLNKQDE